MRAARTLTLLAAGAVALTTTALGAGPSLASYHGDGGWSGGGDYQRGEAVSYINPDVGAPTANPTVNSNSSCFTPDQFDTQAFSPTGTAAKNVHNDACFLDGDRKVDGPASFQSSGVGVISACPDPDNAGPKVAILSADKKLCFQSGYQQKGVAGDLEFHARMNNNTGQAGRQTVVWCSDSDRDGCDDEWNKSTIRIDWSADGTATYSDGGYNRN